MRLGILVVPATSTPDHVARAEERGFDSAWFIDSPMVFGNVWVSMALSAARTSSITLATGVTNPVLQSAPLTASALASVNTWAPGRLVMGIGTGYTSTGSLDLKPASHAALRRYVTEVRALLQGEEVLVEHPDGQSRYAGFVNQTPPWFNLQDPVPICVAAAGPRLLHAAAKYADMILLGGIADPDVIRAARDIITASCAEEGRDPQAVRVVATPSAYLTEQDVDFHDSGDFGRLRDLLGPKSLSPAGNFSRLAEQSPQVPEEIKRDFVAVRGAYGPENVPDGDPATWHIRRYRGYMQELTDQQRPLVTPALLRATTVCGSAKQVIRQITELADAGLDEIVLSPLTQHTGRVIDDFGAQVIPAFSTADRSPETRR
jgi:5,10-methylenetetrahydromethanopterin reductase